MAKKAAAKPAAKSKAKNQEKTSDKAEAAKKKAKSPASKFTSPIDEGDKARFLHHLPKVVAARKAVADATNALRTLYKTAKADGFVKDDFDYAVAVETPEKEAATKEAIRRRLLIARFMGSDLGHQLEIFNEPVRVPATDRAREEGQTASMQGKSAAPPYDPSTPQYKSWLEGYHSHQEQLMSKGFKQATLSVIGGTDKAKKPKPAGGAQGSLMDDDEFQQEQDKAAQALADHGLTADA